jgi:hypothetical protein
MFRKHADIGTEQTTENQLGFYPSQYLHFFCTDLILIVCLLDSLIDPEDRGNMSLRNISKLLPDYTALSSEGSSTLLSQKLKSVTCCLP